MKHHRRSRRDKEKGSTVIEFGLCFLLVFGFIYAIFEFGRVVYSYNVLAGATREASRYAMVHGSQSGSAATSDDIRARVSTMGDRTRPVSPQREYNMDTWKHPATSSD